MFTYDEGFSNAIDSAAECDFIDWQQKKMARAPRILVHFYGTENAWHTICFFYLYEGTLLPDWRINIAPLFSLARSINKTDSDLRVRILSLHVVYLFAFLAGRQWWRRGRYRGGLGQAAQFVWYAGSTPQGRIPHDERSVLWKKKPVCFRYFSYF